MVPARVVVFVGKYASASTVEHVEAIGREFPHWQILVLQEFPPRPPWRRYLRSKGRLLLRQPISFPLELLSRVAGGAVRRSLGRPPHPSVRGLPESLETLKLANVSYRRCASLHAPETLQLLEQEGPWLGISIGAPLLRPCLFRLPEVGTLNIHKSLLPRYRGMPPGFWELYNSEPTTGVSVHWVDEGLDTGNIISQRELVIPRYATEFGLRVQLDLLGTTVLLDALHAVEQGRAEGVPQGDVHEPPNRKPSWLQARSLRKRLWARRQPRRTPLLVARKLAKQVLCSLYFFPYTPLRNALRALFGKNQVTVVLYHRIDDAFLDSTTLGIEQFDKQLSILASKYDVLDLQTFLATRGQRRKQPCVVLTFDDGYEDNYLAAVLLRRHGLPCTFFVATGMIGTDKPFPHDLHTLGYRVPSLTWEQVNGMAEWGFTFGIHTVNHVRLSEVPREEALAEVASAKAELERRLQPSAATRCLAYPYGGKADITDEIRKSLGSIDVEWCFSAYGGVNDPGWEPLNVRRCGVNHPASDLVFRAVLDGWMHETH